MQLVLTENDVVEAVRHKLSLLGWNIIGAASTNERGVDLTAIRDGRTLLIEAKGAGSSKPGTSRFGKAFNRGQVRTHVGVAILKALEVVADGTCHAGIAVPDNADHRLVLDRVADVLVGIGIVIIWVSSDSTVDFQWPPDSE